MNKVIKELYDVSFFSDFCSGELTTSKKISSPFDLIFETKKEHKQIKAFEECFNIDPLVFGISEGLFSSIPIKEKNDFHINFYKNIKEDKDYYYLWYNLILELLQSLSKKRKGVEKETVDIAISVYFDPLVKKNEILKKIKILEKNKDKLEKDFYYFIYCTIMSLKDRRYIKLFFEMSFFKKSKREKMALFYYNFLLREIR